jgi:hypothetical protein
MAPVIPSSKRTASVKAKGPSSKSSNSKKPFILEIASCEIQYSFIGGKRIFLNNRSCLKTVKFSSLALYVSTKVWLEEGFPMKGALEWVDFVVDPYQKISWQSFAGGALLEKSI